MTDSVAPSLPGLNRASRTSHRAGTRVQTDDIAESPSDPPPSSVIAWAWYVDGVRNRSRTSARAARLACAGEGFVWLGLKDPQR